MGVPRRFTFSLDGPSVVSGQPGTKVSFEASVLLDTEFTGTPGLHGAEGWSVNVAAEGGRVVSATFSGTLAARFDDDPPGLVTSSCGVTLLRVDTAAEGPECAGLMVAQSAVDLSFPCVGPPAGLQLEGALPRILRVTVEAVMPAQFTQGVCRVFFPERCAVISPDALVKNVGLFSGLLIPAVEKRELQVTLRGASPSTLFRRADANSSGDVDISDAVSTLGWLFSGTAEPACLAAADSNDSGDVDLSDAIYTLTWLFSAGERPPSPGPFDCGADATPDELPACSGTGC